EAERAPAPVAVHDDALDPVRAAERSRRRHDVPLGDAGPDERRGPCPVSLAEQREALDAEAPPLPQLDEQLHVAGRPVAEPEVGAHDDVPGREALDERRTDELRA